MPAELYDESEWPVVVVTYPAIDVPPELITSIYGHTDKWLSRGQRIGLIIDTSSAIKVSPDARKQVSKELASRREVMGRLVVAALVFPSPFLRGAVTAVHWLNPPSYPWGIFGTVPEAKKWAKAQLEVKAAG